MTTALDPSNTIDPRCVGYAAGLAWQFGDPIPRAGDRYTEIHDRDEFRSGFWLGKDAR